MEFGTKGFVVDRKRGFQFFKGPVRTWVIAQISVCPFSGREKHYRSMRVTFLNTFWMGWSDALLEKSYKIDCLGPCGLL